MDKLTAERRSANMRQIRSNDTTPEIVLRSLVHHLGYRFRLHRRDLPGKPDLVFQGRRRVVFLHGCFWHQHAGCREGRMPGSRRDYWVPKLKRNQIRDTENQALLEQQGWKVLIVWECELKDPKSLIKTLKRFLGRRRRSTALGLVQDRTDSGQAITSVVKQIPFRLVLLDP